MKRTQKRQVTRTTAKKTTTFDVDIAQEFKEVKSDFKEFKNELSSKIDDTNKKLDDTNKKLADWTLMVDRQLTQLNTNMDKVLSQIADHEGRITSLEKKSTQDQTRRETISEIAKFGWTAAKLILATGAVIGAVGGCGWILKLLGIC